MPYRLILAVLAAAPDRATLVRAQPLESREEFIEILHIPDGRLVTVIEVALIVTLMVSGEASETATLARDTVFAAAMITLNGIVGLSLLVGTLRTRLAEFSAEGTATALATAAWPSASRCS